MRNRLKALYAMILQDIAVSSILSKDKQMSADTMAYANWILEMLDAILYPRRAAKKVAAAKAKYGIK